MAKLVLSLNGTVLQQHFIDTRCLKIGRETGNDIVINDPQLSREHARILSVGDDQIIEDLASSNGTRINGKPLTRQILQHRDVVELGAHHLLYLSSRVAADVELERTLLIKALPRNGESIEGIPVMGLAATRPSKTRFPAGSITVLESAGHHNDGDDITLDRVVTTFGTPGDQLIVITRRPQGYFLTHVEGPKYPRVNRNSIGAAVRALRNDDLIEAAGYRLVFKQTQEHQADISR